MKSREEYYPYEGGGRFVEFLSPIEIKAVNRKKPHPRDIIYQPIPGPFRWAFAELVEGLHRTKDNYYPLGVLRVDPDDEQCYYFALVRGYEKIKKSDGLLIKIDEENEKRLYYHDLKELLVNDPS